MPLVEIFSSTKLVDVGGALGRNRKPSAKEIALFNFNCERAAKSRTPSPQIWEPFAVAYLSIKMRWTSEGDIRGISPAIDTTEPKREEFTIRLAKAAHRPPQLPFIRLI